MTQYYYWFVAGVLFIIWKEKMISTVGDLFMSLPLISAYLLGSLLIFAFGTTLFIWYVAVQLFFYVIFYRKFG